MLSTDVVELVPVVVRQSCRTLEAHVAELLLSLAQLQLLRIHLPGTARYSQAGVAIAKVYGQG